MTLKEQLAALERRVAALERREETPDTPFQAVPVPVDLWALSELTRRATP